MLEGLETDAAVAPGADFSATPVAGPFSKQSHGGDAAAGLDERCHGAYRYPTPGTPEVVAAIGVSTPSASAIGRDRTVDREGYGARDEDGPASRATSSSPGESSRERATATRTAEQRDQELIPR